MEGSLARPLVWRVIGAFMLCEGDLCGLGERSGEEEGEDKGREPHSAAYRYEKGAEGATRRERRGSGRVGDGDGTSL